MAALASRPRRHRFATQRLRDARAQTAIYTMPRDMNRLGAMKNRKTSPKYAPEVRERAVRMVFDHAGEYPSQWAASCRPGEALCGTELCLTSGEWHIAWSIPYNGLLLPMEDALGVPPGSPTYWLAVFLLPLVYGAWRFVIFHALTGPILASLLTSNPNETHAIWCLFSIGIILIGSSRLIRRHFETTSWWVWPKSW